MRQGTDEVKFSLIIDCRVKHGNETLLSYSGLTRISRSSHSLRHISTLLVTFIFFFGCGESPKPQPPKSPFWYHNLESKEFEVIGYGYGQSETEAKERAREDIAKQLSVRVSTSTERETKIVGDDFSNSFSHQSTQRTDITLSDLDVLKVFDNRRFVALKYINIPFEKRFLNELGEWKCGEENQFLRYTKLGKEALKSRECLPDITIFKNGDSYFLNSGNSSKLIPNFNLLFFNKVSPVVSMELPNEIEERVDFDIKISSTKDGFVTLLVVSENGDVFEILSNNSITANRELSLKEIRKQLFFGVVENGQNFENSLFITIFSEKSLQSRFLEIRNEDERRGGIGADKLLKIFSRDIDFTSSVQVIAKNHE